MIWKQVPGCNPAGPYSTLEDVASLEQNLAQFGLDMGKIDAVILTHLHFDHCAFLNRFDQCPKFVQKRELSSALHPHPYFSSFYVPRFLENIDFEVIDGDRRLFPGIDVAVVPGHSGGCQAVIYYESASD
jgi:N-acyl homoserine lactone hydrolase